MSHEYENGAISYMVPERLERAERLIVAMRDLLKRHLDNLEFYVEQNGTDGADPSTESVLIRDTERLLQRGLP